MVYCSDENKLRAPEGGFTQGFILLANKVLVPARRISSRVRFPQAATVFKV